MKKLGMTSNRYRIFFQKWLKCSKIDYDVVAQISVYKNLRIVHFEWVSCQKGKKTPQKVNKEIFYRRVNLFGQHTKILVRILFKATRHHVILPILA